MNYIDFVNKFVNTYLKEYLDLLKLKIINVSVSDDTSPICTIDVDCLYNEKEEYFNVSIFKKANKILFTSLFECFTFEEKRLINKAVNKKINESINKYREK